MTERIAGDTTTQLEPLVTRRGSIAPASLDLETRTAEVTFATGARVLRGLFERFHEELSLDPAHVRMGRLTSGAAPVLAAHEGNSLNAVIGVVESAHLARGQGIARLRFAKDDPTADAVWNKVQQGILRNVSVGYRVYKYDKQSGGEAEIPLMRATDWEPFEVSVVPMGADPGAMFRATQFHLEETTMPPTETTDAERMRTSEILRVVRTARLDSRLAEELIADGATVEAAREAVLERLASQSDGGPSAIPAGVRDRYGAVGDDFRQAAADALLLRAGVPLRFAHAAARDLSPSVHEIARTCLSRAGITHGALRGEALITRAMTTSDFPLILADSLGKAIRRGYEIEPASHRAWVRPVPVPNFKSQLRPILGSAPALELVLENGEYQEGPMSEDSANYVVAKYGKIVSLTWEVLVNDDLSAFLRVQPALGQAARRIEADTVYLLFAGSGPTMQDGVALFHANHANLGTSAAFDAAALGAARTLLRKQTALGGGYLSLVPAFLIVPAEREQAAEVLLATATRTTTTAPASATTPAWIGDLRLVVEPRLADGAVYLAASTEQIDTCELGLLEANQDGPTITTETGFIVDLMKWKVRHVFGAKFLDWRGMVKQPIT